MLLYLFLFSVLLFPSLLCGVVGVYSAFPLSFILGFAFHIIPSRPRLFVSAAALLTSSSYFKASLASSFLAELCGFIVYVSALHAWASEEAKAGAGKVSLAVRFTRSLRVVSRPVLFAGYHLNFFLPIGINKLSWERERSSSGVVWPSDLNDEFEARAIG